MDALREAERIDPQQFCDLRVCAIHMNIRTVTKHILVLALGRFHDHKIYAAGIQLAEYFIHGIALAGTCRAGYKGVHRQTIAVEPYCIFADTAHIENLAQQKVCAFFLLVIGDHFLAKICVLYHRKSAHRPPRQPHVDRQFVAADQ